MKTVDNIFYMYSNMDGSSQILLFLIVLVGLMLLSILIINAITRKKTEKYDKKFNPIDKYINVMKKEEKKIKVEPKKEIKIENIKPIKEEKIEVKQKIKEEPEEELEVIEVVSEDSSIDKIAQLLEDSAKPMDPINLTRFEEEQEKNAIISYDELVKRAGSKKIVYKTEKATVNEPKKEEKIEVKAEEQVKGKFRASAVISPIYGIQKEKKEEVEEFLDVQDMPIKTDDNLTDEDLQQDITFLGNLKTFRSNLD